MVGPQFFNTYKLLYEVARTFPSPPCRFREGRQWEVTHPFKLPCPSSTSTSVRSRTSPVPDQPAKQIKTELRALIRKFFLLSNSNHF